MDIEYQDAYRLYGYAQNNSWETPKRKECEQCNQMVLKADDTETICPTCKEENIKKAITKKVLGVVKWVLVVGVICWLLLVIISVFY